MTLQLNQVLQDLYSSLGLGDTRKLTGGTTTTAIDSTLTDGTDEGSIIVVSTTDGLAPQGEFGRITAFATATGTWTIDTLTAAPAAGDYAMICRGDLTLYNAIEVVNRALHKLGDLDFVDTTTLETATQQTEYTASVAWKRKKPKRIDIQTNINDANDNRWITNCAFDWIPAAANSTGLLIFKSQPESLRDIRVWYEDVHPRVTTYAAYIREELHPELVRQATLTEALSYMISETGRGVDPQLVQDYNKAATDLEQVKRSIGFHKEKRKPQYTVLGGTSDRSFTPNVVNL